MIFRPGFYSGPSVGAIASGGAPKLAFTILSDSLGPSRDADNLDANRTGADPEVIGAMQYVNHSSRGDYQTLSTDVSPMWFPDDGTARISFMENMFSSFIGLTGDMPVVIPCGIGGASLLHASNPDFDPAGPGQRLTEAGTAHNAAMTLLKAQDASATVGGIVICLTSNDVIGGSYNSANIRAAWIGLVDYIRTNFDYVDEATPFFFAGPCANGAPFDTARLDCEYAATQRENVFVVHPPFPTADPSNLHPVRAENRAWGEAMGALADTVLNGSQAIPTFTMSGAQTGTVGDALAIAIDHTGLDEDSRYGFVEINGGADAAQFQIGGTWPNQELQWSGSSPAAGDYVVNLRIRNGAWEYGADFPVTVTQEEVGEVSPATFFGSGEAGMVWDLADSTTLFQDIAGTTPVTAAGQTVGRVLDKSGNNNHWTAAADNTTRPTYQVDGDGKPYLSFDGSNDLLIAATPFASTGNRLWTAIFGLYAATQASSRTLLSINSGSNSQPISILQSATTTTGIQQFSRNDSGSGAVGPTLAGMLDSTKRVLTSIMRGGNATASSRNAASRPSGGGSGAYTDAAIGTWGGTFSPTRAGLGGQVGPTPGSYFNGRIYSGFVINRVLTESEIKQGEDWCAARQLTGLLP